MTSRPARAWTVVARHVQDRVDGWRSGSPASQRYVAVVLLGLLTATLAVQTLSYGVAPVGVVFVWLLAGMLLLRYRPLLLLVSWALVGTIGVAVSDALGPGELESSRISATVSLVVASALVLLQSSRQRSGLPTLLGETVLSDLRDRLQRQGTVPPLPEGWRSESAMLAADSVGYAGDFLVARLDEQAHRLEMILVDVVGKGVAAGTAALQFAGALGGLLGAVPPGRLMEAANDFLLRQESDEAFATAVHVVVELRTGAYEVLSAGHPPVLRREGGSWRVDTARGTALGVTAQAEVEPSRGRLCPGDALMFYTDGVVERPGEDIDDGVEWLRTTASDLTASSGLDGLPRRVLRRVSRGDDDRAVLVLHRLPDPAHISR
ncbi:PP2C family protein-serine/threonine phosphatase [Nocardioides sp. OK12]|uniref:PP2C family protein-serine/threonine phosphatase n=1 Tax=Nocardioides sp. OK12 TaxID=2758661 RepID=UPI0021C29B69|nr:PP2C family protein-serine/threonine phosphatase [Nocardioides sp. OK12]